MDTSSQASVEEGEASLESNPINVSPTRTTYSSCSESPMVDLTELQGDANLAADHMLSIKRSMDLKRQWIRWELGLHLCQNEAEEAAANKKAKVLHSCGVLDSKVDCTRAVLEARFSYRVAVQEAKTIQGNCLQELEVAYSKALGETTAMRSSKSTTLYREHVKLMHELEEWAIREESKGCHNFLSTCQAILLHVPQPLKENLTTSYHILLGQSPPSPQYVPLARELQAGEQPSATASPRPEPKRSPWPNRWHPLPDPWGSMSMDETSSKASQEGQSCSKRRETPFWFASLKPSCAEAFSHDSDLVKEAWLHFFSTQSCDWAIDSANDLSDVFRELAEGASLLGEAIHEVQLSWTGPDELKQANYALRSMPKGLRFLRAVPTTESSKVMGLMGIHDPNALHHFAGYTYCPWCGKEGQNEGTVVNHLRTTHYRLGLVCPLCFGCPTVTSDALCWHGHQNCQRYHATSGSGLST